MKITVADIAQFIHGEVIGDSSVEVTGCSGIQEARPGNITFLVGDKYLDQAAASQASVIIIPRQMSLPGKTVIKADHPSLAFTKVLTHFFLQPYQHPEGIDPTAIISPDARVHETAVVGPYTIIEAGAVIGPGAVIYGQCYVGRETVVGEKTLIYPSVVLREQTVIGKHVIIHSGTVIGCDGYGYVTVDGKHAKIPQIGIVVVEDDVEIGANVTIDRARFDKTVIGEGTKIDNLVHIAHNVIIGKHCLIVAQVGISGSTRVGNYVVLAGQVGVVGHLTIGDGAVVAAQSGISKSIKPGEQVFGTPAQPIKQAFRTNAHVQRLDHYVDTIRELRHRIEALEKKISG